MSAEVLRRAAWLMRERALAASPAPWQKARGRHGEGVRSGRGAILATLHSEQGREDMRHIASWHPAVALAVADWLDDAAHLSELDGAIRHYALAVARAYLGEPA